MTEPSEHAGFDKTPLGAASDVTSGTSYRALSKWQTNPEKLGVNNTRRAPQVAPGLIKLSSVEESKPSSGC